MTIVHIPDTATFIDDKPVEEHPEIHPYVEFPSLERASYGFAHVEKAGRRYKVLDSREVGETGFEPIALFFEFRDALGELENRLYAEEAGKTLHGPWWSIFEESSMVLIDDKREYDDAMKVAETLDRRNELRLHQQRVETAIAEGLFSSSPREREYKKKESEWDGPGLYDFREFPFTRSYGSVSEYEISVMKDEADNILEYMYQGDERVDVLEEFVKEVGPSGLFDE